MADKAPVEKLSLAVRKNVRDNFESNKGDWEKQIANLIGADSFTININPNLVFAYAEENSYGSNNLGSCINSYVESFVDRLKQYVKDGKDEEAKEALRKIVKQSSLTFLPTTERAYCGLEIKDGIINLLFNVNNLGTNLYDVAGELPAEVDKALDALGGNDLPVVARRSIQQNLDPLIPKLQQKMKAMFGKDYTFAYDTAASLAAMKADEDAMRNYAGRLNTIVPEWTAQYFSTAIDQLENKKFGKDDMLQEAFVDATDKLTVRFRIVDKLQSGKTYNDARFDGGEFVIETVAKYFGTNIYDTAGDVVDKL